MNDRASDASDEGAPRIAHSFSLTAFSKERTYQLEPDALSWGDGQKSGRVAYADIARVHIYSQPPYRGQIMRRTILSGRFPGKLKLQAASYGGLGKQVEDRSESYFAFVEALIARVAAANPDLRIRVGQPWPLYIFWVVLFVVFLLMVPLMLAILFDGDGNPEALGGLALCAVFLYFTGRIVWRGRPRRGTPRSLYDSDLAGGRK